MKSARSHPAHVVLAKLKRAHVGQYEIAAALGVSQAAVSLTIRRRRGVAPDTAARIWAAIDKALAPQEMR